MCPVRRTKLIILATGILLAVAAVLTFASSAAARRWMTSPHRVAATTTAESGSRPTQESSPKPSTSPSQVTSVSAAIGLRPGAVSPSAAGIAAAEAVLPKLTPLQLAGQRVIYSYPGLTPPRQLLWLISHGQAAGVIFFTENVGTTAHLRAVVRELNLADASRSNPVHLPLLLMTDQEGGIVRRLPGAPRLSAKQVGLATHPWAAATDAGNGAGANLRGVGLNVNLAPVLDVYRKPGNFIDQYGRSFSNSAVKVAKLGSLYAAAEQRRGVAATVKHFPGLGAAATSQNTDLRPVTLRLPLSSIRSVDELPYKSAVAGRTKLVMLSWAIYPALDRSRPAGLSARIVQGELRQRLGFAGVTITDALEAGALRPFGSIGHRATLAAGAGMDLLLCGVRDYHEGYDAMRALAYAYQHGALNARSFKAAAERVIALRATLPR
ncbi:MAG TPA: glycoside hydrolase family 3 N-terminal domain-containing protein [Streptosporangiaceae bacterium]|nr:glycoside hydrolase family 3 N-terminal domain-containing protein [Streptosporangiaceae bacterium]